MNSISAVVPSYRRREALLQALPNHLELHGVDEIVVVDDGSGDGTAEAIWSLNEPRIKVVQHEVNRGLPAARNTGAAAARGEWILYLEDDCGFPMDYAERLLETALEHEADVVGAPWVDTPANLEASTAYLSPVDRFELLSAPWSFPTEPVETPFMPALSLINRRVFEKVTYDEGYRGNFYREETDFYISARRAGFRVFLTPTTYSWQLGRYDGGCRPRGRQLQYDLWAIRNTWRLLKKHGAWLRESGLMRDHVYTVQARLIWSRIVPHLQRAARVPRWALRRLRGTTSPGADRVS